MIPDHPFDDYRNRRVLIMGLGSFGGGMGAAKFLIARGASVTVTDLRPAEKLVESLAQLSQTPPTRLVLGRHDEDDFRNAELVVANPAVKRDCPFLNAAIRAGVPVTSEMNLFWKWNPAPIIAVTGSNGKSTTTAMIHAIVDRFLSRNARRAWLGGNIGSSLLPVVDQIQARDVVVLELSSFQLADLDRLQVSPHVAVVTNFAPNHLDWHPDLDHYRRSKEAILRWQTHGDIAVLNDDDPDVCAWTVRGKRRGFGLQLRDGEGAFLHDRQAVLRLSPPTGPFPKGSEEDARKITSQSETETVEKRWPLRNWLNLPGDHNVANALAAIATAVSIGAEKEDVQSAIENYRPLPHRLQWIADVEGRRFFNDSLATTPESTEVALKSFESPIIVLAGGYDKHVDLSAMAAAIANKTKAASLMGQTAGMLKDLIEDCDAKVCVASDPQPTFVAAFDWAIEQSEHGDVILLSPGCASYDWFRNFSDRGLQFIELVCQYEARSRSMTTDEAD